MGEKASILIVDDNISLCKTISFVLGRKGYAVTTAEDGPEAIEKVKENPFDMIFMDIKMPLMDGVETYRRIKKIRPEAVVMMMTAYAVEELVQEALQEGAYGITYKPLDIERMVAVIEEAGKAKEPRDLYHLEKRAHQEGLPGGHRSCWRGGHRHGAGDGPRCHLH
jgi:CheY-like chemotaxis protein